MAGSCSDPRVARVSAFHRAGSRWDSWTSGCSPASAGVTRTPFFGICSRSLLIAAPPAGPMSARSWGSGGKSPDAGEARGAATRCDRRMTAGGTSAEVPGPHGSRHRSRLPWRPLTMEIAFAAGSACFLIGPFPGYVQLVGPAADAITFFVGSVLFTIGGALQLWLAAPVRRQGGAGRAAFLAALAQTLGTLFFNRTTFQALQTAVTAPDYNHLVWRPDAFGSICFLLSGII